MSSEEPSVIHIVAFIWMFGLLGLWSYVYYKGRALLRVIKQKYPEHWKELGKPEPYYFIPNQTWSQFISKETYRDFEDSQLTRMCERQRRLERITAICFISTFVIVGGIAIWDSFVKEMV